MKLKIAQPIVVLVSVVQLAGCATNTPSQQANQPVRAIGNTQRAQPIRSLTYLVSAENPDKYCNGADMDSAGFGKTITTEKTATISDVSPTEIQRIKSIIDLATTGMCQTALGQLDISVSNGTVNIPPMEGWAGISIALCSCQPEVEVNLLRIPGITKVVWQE